MRETESVAETTRANSEADPTSEWLLDATARTVSDLYRAASTGDWRPALAGLAATAGVGEVRIVVKHARSWDTFATSAEAPGRGQRSLSMQLAGRGLRLISIPEPGPRFDILFEVVEGQLPAIFEFARGLERERGREATARATLDRLDVGVVIVDERGAVAQINRAAAELLEAEPTLSAAIGGGIECSDGEIQRELVRMVARMVGASADPSVRVSEHLEIPRAGRRPLRMLVVPLLAGAEIHSGACAVFLSDPEVGLILPEVVLQRHYRLTPGESRVASRLLRGLGVDQVAADLGVTRETVRSHVKRIYAKVGTTRQCDLVALVLRGPAGLRWD